MKLKEEYIIRKSYKAWTWFLVYLLFFTIFWNRIESLSAGGILFVYECMIVVFVVRYLRQLLYVKTARMMDKDIEGETLTLNPTFWSVSSYSLKEVLTLELRPMLILSLAQLFLIAISHFVYSASYVTPVLFGALVLSLAVYNQSYIILFRCLRHPNATYKYGFEAFKVYNKETVGAWPTSEKLIRTILRSSH